MGAHQVKHANFRKMPYFSGFNDFGDFQNGAWFGMKKYIAVREIHSIYSLWIVVLGKQPDTVIAGA